MTSPPGECCCVFPEHQQRDLANFGVVRVSQFGDGSREQEGKFTDELLPAAADPVQHLGQGRSGNDRHDQQA